MHWRWWLKTSHIKWHPSLSPSLSFFYAVLILVPELKTDVTSESWFSHMSESFSSSVTAEDRLIWEAINLWHFSHCLTVEEKQISFTLCYRKCRDSRESNPISPLSDLISYCSCTCSLYLCSIEQSSLCSHLALAS